MRRHRRDHGVCSTSGTCARTTGIRHHHARHGDRSVTALFGDTGSPISARPEPLPFRTHCSRWPVSPRGAMRAFRSESYRRIIFRMRWWRGGDPPSAKHGAMIAVPAVGNFFRVAQPDRSKQGCPPTEGPVDGHPQTHEALSAVELEGQRGRASAGEGGVVINR